MDMNHWILTVFVLFGLILDALSEPSPAKITVPPKDIKVLENGIAIFYCFVTGDPSPEITWLKNGKAIPPGKRRFSILDVKKGSLLRVTHITAKKDTILITCDVSNGKGKGDSASAALHIYKTGQEPEGFPIITTQPNFRVVETGRSTVMTCAAAGDPPPKLSWLKEWEPVDMNEPRFSMLPSGSLRIERTKPSDGGKYECVANNSLGTDYSYGADLHVRVRKVYPYITDSPPSQLSVNYGEMLNLTCVASGNPEPKVFWVGDTKPVTADENVPFGKNSLILVSMKRTGNYTCVAISELGTTQFTTQVTVKDKGIRPAFIVIPQDQVVEYGGRVNMICEATGRPLPDVVWIKDSLQITTKQESVKGRSILMLTNVTNTANYTCVAGSPLGMVSVTAKVIIRLPGPSMVPKEDMESIKYLIVKSATPNSVTLYWKPPIRPGVTKYVVSWHRGSGLESTNSSELIQVFPDPVQNNASSVTVSGLKPSSRYTFTVGVMFTDGTTSFTTIVGTTKIRAPDISGVPKVLTTEQKTICTIHLDLNQFILQVQPSEYTYFLLVVVPTDTPTLQPDEIMLENRTMAETSNSAYITAEFNNKLPNVFILGDGQLYGSYVNRQLLNSKKYRIFLRVYTVDPKSSEAVHASTGYSDVLHGDDCIKKEVVRTNTQPRTISRSSGTAPSSWSPFVVLVFLALATERGLPSA